MNADASLSLLAEVQKYFETATPEQIKLDMAAADFDGFRGMGDAITAADLQQSSIAQAADDFTQSILHWGGPAVAPLAAVTFPAALNLSPAVTVSMTAIAGNTEEMPLAA